ncbi:hypothetical protein BGX34_008902 [Mortierella sp. NVP85]|nr:hypothetical protein BGX34_008902 [Mortierella sp. NVP85]
MAGSEHNAQIFRLRSSHETTSIPTRLDVKSGQRVVLWKDVLQYFKHAEGILNEGEAVLFLTDDNFEYLTPLRIPHCPSVVLEVVGNNAPGESIATPKDEAIVPTEATLPEPRIQDCMSPPLAGKSLHMELSTLSLPDATDGYGTQESRMIVSEDSQSALPEDQSEASKSIAATETDNPPPMPAAIETPEGSKDGIQTPCEATDFDYDSVPQQEDSSHKDNSCDSPMEEMIVVQSGSLTIYTHPSIQAYHQLRHSYARAVKEGRSTQAMAIDCAMRELFEKLEIEMDKIRDYHQQMVRAQDDQVEVAESQQQMLEDEKQFDNIVQETVEHRQQHRIQDQHRVEEPQLLQTQLAGEEQEHRPLDSRDTTPPGCIPDIQDRVIAMLSQNYELHEYPYPRLFVVLPKVLGSNKIHKSVSGQFRLYFLCECGAHTMPKGCTTSHQVHLANHQGYDITKPTEFFEKYGRYVLVQMYMIKYGIGVSGLVVTPFSRSNIMGRLDKTKVNLDYVHRNIEALVNDSIEFLQDLTRGWGDRTDTGSESMRLDRMEVMEEGERRPLKWYLKRDADRGFGNLYRMVTPRGHVKWACKEHYLALDPKLTVQTNPDETPGGDLCEFQVSYTNNTSNLDGIFNYRLGYYVEARMILRYRITLAGSSNFNYLSKAAPKVNAVDLAMDGSSIWCTQYAGDPIMQIISNGRIQTLRLLSSQDLTFIVGISSISRGPKMRVLELQSFIDAENGTGMSYLGRILACYPNLVYIGLRLVDQVSLVKVMTLGISKLKKLERLELYYGPFYTAADISRGNITALQMNLPFTKHQTFKGTKLPTYSQDLDEPLALDQLVEVLCESPTIEDIVVGYQDLNPMDIIKIVSSRLKNPSYAAGLPLRKMELISIRDRQHTPSTRISMAFTQTGVESEIRIGQWEDTDSAVYTNFFRNYGATVRALDITNRTFDDGFARLLAKSTNDNGSDLTSLGLDARSLSSAGLECINHTISRSKDLERLELFCEASCIQTEQENVQRFLETHGKKVTRLNIRAHSLDALTAWIKRVLPSRGALSSLVNFQLTLPGSLTLQYSQPYVQWLVEMVSVLPIKSSSSLVSLADTSLTECPESLGNGAGTSLKRIYLNGIKLNQDEWARILVAIDFSALEELNLKGTNFSLENVDSLVKSIGLVGSMAPLQTLDLSGTSLSQQKTLSRLTPFEDLRKKAPSIQITGIEHFGVF